MVKGSKSKGARKGQLTLYSHSIVVTVPKCDDASCLKKVGSFEEAIVSLLKGTAFTRHSAISNYSLCEQISTMD